LILSTPLKDKNFSTITDNKALLREIVVKAFIGIPLSRMKIRIWPRKFLHQ
jgi:hypothetical protein